ncbi:MAG: CZB domain-containing protein [Gallionella sp.]|nr:CZB domain-containing protein [Gallionella sp.]
MGVLSWLKRITAGEENAGNATFAPGEEDFHGLNMKDAIDAHVAWKTRLEAEFAGTGSETLEIGYVASDERCKLGQWIHKEGKNRFAQLPEYKELVDLHAQFHLNAGNILLEAHRNGSESAEKMLHGSEFRNASDMVQIGLVRLYARSRSI